MSRGRASSNPSQGDEEVESRAATPLGRDSNHPEPNQEQRVATPRASGAGAIARDPGLTGATIQACCLDATPRNRSTMADHSVFGKCLGILRSLFTSVFFVSTLTGL